MNRQFHSVVDSTLPPRITQLHQSPVVHGVVYMTLIPFFIGCHFLFISHNPAQINCCLKPVQAYSSRGIPTKTTPSRKVYHLLNFSPKPCLGEMCCLLPASHSLSPSFCKMCPQHLNPGFPQQRAGQHMSSCKIAVHCILEGTPVLPTSTGMHHCTFPQTIFFLQKALCSLLPSSKL